MESPTKFRKSAYRSALSKRLNGLTVPETSKTVIRYDGIKAELGAHITVELFIPSSELLPVAVAPSEEPKSTATTSAKSGKAK